MTATLNPPMSPRRAEIIRRSSHWLTTAALLALTPKCVVCVAAYLGLAATLGLAGPEFCGAPAGSADSWRSSLAVLAVIFGAAGLFASVRCRVSRR